MGRRRHTRENRTSCPSDADGQIRYILKQCRTARGSELRELLSSLSATIGAESCAELLRCTRIGADETALHLACAYNPHACAVPALVAYGADVNAHGMGAGHRTPLHEASRTGRAQHVQELLRAGVRVDAFKSGEWTALLLAAHAQHEQVVQILLNAGANILQCNSHGEGSAYLAARGDGTVLSTVLRAATEQGVLAKVVHCPTRNGRISLHAAARAGALKSVAGLVEYGCRVANRDKGGMTAAHEAAAMGNVDVLKYLLTYDDSGAHSADVGGLWAIHHAAIGGHTSCVETLMDDVHVRDGLGNTPLELAALRGRVEIAHLLAKRGCRARACVTEKVEALGYSECAKILKCAD